MWALERKGLSGSCFRTLFLYSAVAQRTQKHTWVNPDVGEKKTTKAKGKKMKHDECVLDVVIDNPTVLNVRVEIYYHMTIFYFLFWLYWLSLLCPLLPLYVLYFCTGYFSPLCGQKKVKGNFSMLVVDTVLRENVVICPERLFVFWSVFV